jgi:hypothetical protein
MDIVPASIVVIGAMERLVQIGYEVHDEFKGLIFGFGTCGVVAQHGDKAGNRGGDAIPVRAIPGRVNR